MAEPSGKIRAISLSSAKGVRKNNVVRARLVEDWGLEGDAHAGPWHRQVSLLAWESIQKMFDLGLCVSPGDFAENITTEGLVLTRLVPGDRLRIGPAELEVTQIGKECHNRCAIYEQAGDCVMPREGIFAKVIQGGEILPGDKVLVSSSLNLSADHSLDRR